MSSTPIPVWDDSENVTVGTKYTSPFCGFICNAAGLLSYDTITRQGIQIQVLAGVKYDIAFIRIGSAPGAVVGGIAFPYKGQTTP